MGPPNLTPSQALRPSLFALDEYQRIIFNRDHPTPIPISNDRTVVLSTNLMDKHEELKNVHEDLVNKKADFKVKMQLSEMRKRRLQEKECSLKESLLKFEKFLKDNDDKRVRALKKLSLERGLQKQRMKHIDELNQNILSLSAEKNKLEAKAKRLEKYKLFLQQAVKTSGEFNDTSELISRYESLSANLNDLMKKEELNSDTAQRLEAGLHQYREDKCDEKMFLLNTLTELRRSLEFRQTECHDKQSALAHEKDAAVCCTKQLTALKLAIQNMYEIARKFQKFGSEAHPDDTESQLDVVATFILDMALILKNLAG